MIIWNRPANLLGFPTVTTWNLHSAYTSSKFHDHPAPAWPHNCRSACQCGDDKNGQYILILNALSVIKPHMSGLNNNTFPKFDIIYY
ncbi:hypothetical protein MTBSS4_200023 [Magnetospirillum sp. SS-4]|nr:hypothetical protein MTBSS4_200023 [Magnetospirillum sp. SS-4]